MKTKQNFNIICNKCGKILNKEYVKDFVDFIREEQIQELKEILNKEGVLKLVSRLKEKSK